MPRVSTPAWTNLAQISVESLRADEQLARLGIQEHLSLIALTPSRNASRFRHGKIKTQLSQTF
jgi:hypothetical protein